MGKQYSKFLVLIIIGFLNCSCSLSVSPSLDKESSEQLAYDQSGNEVISQNEETETDSFIQKESSYIDKGSFAEPIIDFKLIYEKLDYLNISGQDADQYNGIVVCFNALGKFSLIDIKTGALISSNRPIHGDIVPHANSVCFGSEKYDEQDFFPIIYVNAYNNPGNNGKVYFCKKNP